VNTNAAALIVPPPGPALETNDIRAIKPPVDVPDPWTWLWWALVVLALAALAAWAWRRWRTKRLQPPPVPVIPPHVRAKRRLDEALALLHDPRQFCIAVSDAARLYLEERFDFRAPERTTEEFLVELQGTDRLAPDQKESLAQFLQSCDLVKFARFEPTEAALRELHDSAVRLVDETAFEPVVAEGATASVTNHAARTT
jgi:hypothetical protein